jgi:hypothetical protein
MADLRAGATPDIGATLAAWRARGADRLQPARFRLIDALARRASRFDGDARRLLDARLTALIADYSREIERADAERMTSNTDSEPARHTPDAAGRTAAHRAPPRSALGELVDLLASRRPVAPGPQAATLAPSPIARDDASSDHPMLDYFRETWSRFSTEKHLRESLAQVPDNAGPLNSNSLVHRSLSLMRELSPGYLRQFLAYVDALSCMEQVAGPATPTGGAAAPTAATQRAAGAKKSARGKAR